MNALKNKVQLVGNLGKDPEVTNFDNGKTKVRFSLATTEVYYDAKGNKTEDTQWHNIVAWNNNAKRIEKLLTKGSSVMVDGKITYRDYDDKNGNKRYITEILCNEFILMK